MVIATALLAAELSSVLAFSTEPTMLCTCFRRVMCGFPLRWSCFCVSCIVREQVVHVHNKDGTNGSAAVVGVVNVCLVDVGLDLSGRILDGGCCFDGLGPLFAVIESWTISR